MTSAVGPGSGAVARTQAAAWPARLSIDGEMTIYRAAELKERIARAFHGSSEEAFPAALGANHDVDLDLSEVSELDAAGLQLLLLFNRRACMGNRRLRLVAPSEAVTNALALVHLTAAFECVPLEHHMLTVSHES